MRMKPKVNKDNKTVITNFTDPVNVETARLAINKLEQEIKTVKENK